MGIRSIETREAEIRKVAASLRYRWHRGVERSASPKPETFIAEKNESLVFENRSANSGAKLVLRKGHWLIRFAGGGFGLVVKELVGIQNFISQVFIAFAMPGVGSRLGAHVDDATRKLSPLRTQIVVLDFEFRN